MTCPYTSATHLSKALTQNSKFLPFCQCDRQWTQWQSGHGATERWSARPCVKDQLHNFDIQDLAFRLSTPTVKSSGELQDLETEGFYVKPETGS